MWMCRWHDCAHDPATVCTLLLCGLYCTLFNKQKLCEDFVSYCPRMVRHYDSENNAKCNMTQPFF